MAAIDEAELLKAARAKVALDTFDADVLAEKWTKGNLQCMAKVAEACERFDDMALFMKILVAKALKEPKDTFVMEQENRNLLSVSYKHVVGGMRTAWRNSQDDVNQLKSHASQEDDGPMDKKHLKKYQEMIAIEIENLCLEIMGLLDKLVKASATNMEKYNESDKSKSTDPAEHNVFYRKMMGDYYRYILEIFPKESECNEEQLRKVKDFKEKVKEMYLEATKTAEKSLPETHPTRLGLALNFSVCYYEILDEKKQACEVAKKAFDEAIEKLDTLNDASYKDSTLIMQLLRDNLTLWTSDQGEQDDDGQVVENDTRVEDA